MRKQALGIAGFGILIVVIIWGAPKYISDILGYGQFYESFQRFFTQKPHLRKFHQETDFSD